MSYEETFLVRIRTQGAYVCSRRCDWLEVTASEATARCRLFHKDVTMLPPENIPQRCTQCMRIEPRAVDIFKKEIGQ